MSTYNAVSRYLNVSPYTGVQVSRVEPPAGTRWHAGKVHMSDNLTFDVDFGLVDDRLLARPKQTYNKSVFEQLFRVEPGCSITADCVIEITNYKLI